MVLVQFMWENGTIPTYLGWKILRLIPKGNLDNQGIGLPEVLWKVMGVIIDTHIKKSMAFHDALHGFLSGRGTGTAIMELKLAQEMESVD